MTNADSMHARRTVSYTSRWPLSLAMQLEIGGQAYSYRHNTVGTHKILVKMAAVRTVLIVNMSHPHATVIFRVTSRRTFT